MVKVTHPKVDPEQLLARVREVVERTPERARTLPTGAPPTGALSSGAALDALDAALVQVEGRWQVGIHPPPMHKVPGPARRVAGVAAQLVLRVAQLVTRDQRDFNEATLRALRAARDHGRHLGRVVNGRVAELQGQLGEQLETLTRSVTALEARLGEAQDVLRDEASAAHEAGAQRQAETSAALAALGARVAALAERLERHEADTAKQQARLAALLEEVRQHLPPAAPR